MGWNPFFARSLERSRRASHPPPFPSIASATTARLYFYNIWDGNVDFGYTLPTSLSIHGGRILLLVVIGHTTSSPFVHKVFLSGFPSFFISGYLASEHVWFFVYIAERSERALDLFCL
jgi:hypothetical protein